MPDHAEIFSWRNHCATFERSRRRCTRYLAEKLGRVIGVDVSLGSLNVARKHLRDSGLDNVHLIAVDSTPSFDSLPAEFPYTHLSEWGVISLDFQAHSPYPCSS